MYGGIPSSWYSARLRPFTSRCDLWPCLAGHRHALRPADMRSCNPRLREALETATAAVEHSECLMASLTRKRGECASLRSTVNTTAFGFSASKLGLSAKYEGKLSDTACSSDSRRWILLVRAISLKAVLPEGNQRRHSSRATCYHKQPAQI